MRPEYTASVADLGSSREVRAWNEFVLNEPDSVNYHQTRWLDVVERAFGHKVYPLWVRNDHEEVRGILPLVHIKSAIFGDSLTSVPFFNYGGVLAKDEAAAAGLTSKAEELLGSTGADFVELRHMGRRMERLPAKAHKVAMHLELPNDSEELWSGFKAKVRNQVRKAEKSGLTASSGRHELLDDFHRVFARNMRDLGTPVYPRKFFATVLDMFPESARIFTVNHEEGCVAAGLGSWFKGSFEIPWASSIREYNPLCPNNLLYWHMLRFACENGCTRFDFGRSTPNKGTYRFKKQWGARPVQLYWQYLLPEGEGIPEVNPDNPKFDLAIRIWKRLPVFLTKLLGPHIVRSIP